MCSVAYNLHYVIEMFVVGEHAECYRQAILRMTVML